MKVGFAGAGNMAGAMARGWAAGDGGPEEMLFCDLEAERAQHLATEVGGETRAHLAALSADADAVVLAVKPAALDAAAPELRGAPSVISILAATPLARLAEALPGVPVLRVMPNQPVEVRRGVLVHPPAEAVAPEMAERLLEMLGALGTLVELPEEQIEAAMAVMSCSPAYVALFAERLADAGAREGLDPAVAAELVSATVAGTAEQLRVREPQALRAAVAPPGGATEAGLEALDRGGFGAAIDDAVTASLERFR